jgi:tRNA(Ile)-lysidine synthase
MDLPALLVSSAKRSDRYGDNWCVAFSGGLDSSVLLDAAAQCRDRYGISVAACHVNHGLSPNSEQWQDHCEQFCSVLGIPLSVHRITFPSSSGRGIEDVARQERYRSLDGMNADVILLGHHQDDQAETVLLNLLRGAGITGLAGIPHARGRYVRPFLAHSKEQLEKYALERGLTWITDESNANVDFSRNFIREEIVPALSLRYPAVSKKLASTAQFASEALSLLAELALLDDPSGDLRFFPISIDALRELSDSRLANLIRAKLKACDLQSPSRLQLSEFVRQLKTFRPDRHPVLRTRRWTLSINNRMLHLVIE